MIVMVGLGKSGLLAAAMLCPACRNTPGHCTGTGGQVPKHVCETLGRGGAGVAVTGGRRIGKLASVLRLGTETAILTSHPGFVRRVS